MNLRQLEYFLTVANEQNITKAAKKLNISQPPLSRSLMDLESELGVTLFIRGKRSTELTPEGLLLKKRAQQILNLTHKTTEEVQGLNKNVRGTLYLGLVEAKGPMLAAKWISGFKKLYPDVTFNLRNGNSDELTDRLRAGLLDAAITMEPFNNEILSGFRVDSEPWVAMIPINDPLASSDAPLHIRELNGKELIIPSRRSRSGEISSWFEKEGAEPSFKVVIANSSNACELTKEGIGIAIFPASLGGAIDRDKVALRKILPEVTAYYLLSWEKEKTLSDPANKFIEYVNSLTIKERSISI